MVKWWQGILLGIIQGMTEFLPVSSSGHLVLFQSILKNFHQPGILFDIALHLATALSVVVYFYKDLISLLKRKRKQEVVLMADSGKLEKLNWTLLWSLISALIPTAIIGLLLKNIAEAQFENPFTVAIFLIITGIILFLADTVATKRKTLLRSSEPGIFQSILIGISQGLAVFPGLSRSGITISTGIFSGIRGDYSARFSFLLSVPAVLGASLLSIHDEKNALLQFQATDVFIYLLSMTSAFITGYLSIWLVFSFVRKIKLKWFGAYCLLAGVISIIIWEFYQLR